MEPSDEELVTRILGGDEEAVALLFDRHLARLRARVRDQLPALLRRRVAESDVIQECYMTAFQRLADFEDRGAGSFGRWLRQILRNKVHDEVERHLRQRRNARRDVSRSLRADTNALPRANASPSAHAIAGETRERVLAAVAALPEDYRRVLRLVHDEGLSVAEAAAHFERSVEATRKLYSRAVSRLAEMLGT